MLTIGNARKKTGMTAIVPMMKRLRRYSRSSLRITLRI
jgi:hypothetical protein